MVRPSGVGRGCGRPGGHRTAASSPAHEVAEVDRREPGGVEQLHDHGLRGLVIAGDEQDSAAARLSGIGAAHVRANRVGRLHQPCAPNQLGNDLARCASIDRRGLEVGQEQRVGWSRTGCFGPDARTSSCRARTQCTASSHAAASRSGSSRLSSRFERPLDDGEVLVSEPVLDGVLPFVGQATERSEPVVARCLECEMHVLEREMQRKLG